MRLRQCVFVCKDLESSAEELCDILGIEVAYRDPGVAKWGLVNVVCPTGLATMGDVLELCREVTASDAELVWVDGAFLVDHEVAPWTELPIWLPEDDEAYALHTCDVTRALAWGLPTRPLRETVADAWTWVQRVDAGLETPAPAPRAGTGLDPAKEAAVLAAWDAR